MKPFHLISGKDITEENISEALKLDYICYEEKYYLDLETCLSYHKKNPWIYFMALDDSGSVIGYVNLSPISKKKYEELRSGYEMDTTIVADDIRVYKRRQKCYLYFSSICVHPEWRRKGVARSLLSQIDLFIENLISNGIIIKSIIADAVSYEGRLLLSHKGFEMVCESNHKSIIMEKIYD